MRAGRVSSGIAWLAGMVIVLALTFAVTVAGRAAAAGPPADPFASIDGGTISLADYAGRPVMIVNTASLCAFTPQYDALQDLYDAYRDRGLVVLAVPSDDFRQELASAEAVRDFCAVNFDIDMPMTDITPVRGARAHPVFRWLKAEAGFEPRWNFAKVLIDREGRVAGQWPSQMQPMAPAIRAAVEAALR